MEMLFALAGGFENSAFVDEVEVTRLSFDVQGRARIATFKVGIRAAMDNNFQLQPLDRIRVSRIPNWSYGDTVELTGSILFPGDYPIVPGEMLSSIINRAGGVSENGFPQGAVLIKVEAKKGAKQLERLIADSTKRARAVADKRTRK